MLLGKEASIIADSTVSSSPAQAANASPQIKRATRTYGKRREEPLVEGTTASTWYPTSSSENVHKTAPPGLKETIPASSPVKIPMDSDALDAIMWDDKPGRRHNGSQIEKGSPTESDSHLENEHSLPKFKTAWRAKLMEIDRESSEEGDLQSERKNNSFGWRERMMEIDKAFKDDSPDATSTSDKLKDTYSFGRAMLLQEANSGTIQAGARASTPPPSVSDDVFNGPSSSLSRLDASQSPFLLSSSTAPDRSCYPKRRVVRDSDSEEEIRKDSSSTDPSTSGHNSFLSVKSRSSSTQPTSDEDMPSKISVNPKLSHSRKPESPRVSVPPFGLTELSSKRGRKSKRTKLKVFLTRPSVNIC